jgi:hypothetical protein
MNNQVIADDGKIASELQQAELGQAGVDNSRLGHADFQGPQPIQYGYAAPQVVHGKPVTAGPGVLGPTAITSGVPNGGYPVGATIVVNERELVEHTALRYRFSVMCFAFIDLFFTCFRIAQIVAVELVQEDESEGENMLSPASLWWFGVLGLVFLIGPICGFLGAKRLRRNLVTIYLAFCIGNLAHEMAWALLTLHIWLLITAVIQLWITKIVFTFWKALGLITPDRCQAILEPGYVPNEPIRMVYF